MHRPRLQGPAKELQEDATFEVSEKALRQFLGSRQSYLILVFS